MRTGEFARKHNITHDTIRHYLKMGLLATKKDGGHYKFSEGDSRDIEKITELKQLDFSLVEIQKMLCFQRLAGEKANEYRSHCLSLLEEKRDEINKEQERYKEMSIYVESKIKDLRIAEEKSAKTLGLHISAIDLLQCPNCKEPLHISDGVIDRNMLIKANIKCECKYEAIIKDGIYIDETAVRERTGMNGNNLPTKKEYLEAASPKYINFLYSGMSMLIDNIKEYGGEPKYILELDGCVGFFLMQYIKDLPKNSTYILIDYDKDRITKLKNNLETLHKHKNFIFLCCDVDRLPIKNSTIDIIIDNCMTANYGRTNNQSLLDIVLSMLKRSGLITGISPYFNPMSRDFNNIKADIRDYYCRDKLLERLLDHNVHVMDLMDIGPIIEDSPFASHIKDKELYNAVYVGRNGIDLKTNYMERRMKESKIS